MAGLTLWCYRLLALLLYPLIPWRLRRKARQDPRYGEHLAERWARYDARAAATLRFRQQSGPLFWLHAVSVGETRAALPLILALRQAQPELRLLLTHSTPTGRAMAAHLLAEPMAEAQVLSVYLPYDYPHLMRRFFQFWQPRLGLVMETELWPEMLRAAQAAAVPMVLANARLSERSLRGYLRLAPLARRMVQSLAWVAAQSPDDARRLQRLGARSVSVTGNLKFDAVPPPALQALGQHWRQQAGARPVFLFLSSREGEEALWLQAWQAQRQHWPDVLWVLLPRHPERVPAVQALLEQAGLALQRRSEGPPSATCQVWLGDSMGEVVAYSAMAEACLLGGSFQACGGQNLIEPCSVGTPVWTGPSLHNFAQVAADAEQAGAAVCCADMAQALQALRLAWLDQPTWPARRQAAFDFSQQHQGATARVLAGLAPWLDKPHACC